MLSTTVARLRCLCGGALELLPTESLPVPFPEPIEVRSGSLTCVQCRRSYLILEGVALMVEDAHGYLLEHVKGISKLVPDSAIPEEYREDYLEAKAGIQAEHIEEDLEAERVNALYLMNHYLTAADEPWWKSAEGGGSRLIETLVREHWDQGPFAQISRWVNSSGQSAVELGCGVGGLYRALRPRLKSYLGLDSSFASIALARHLALGAPYRSELRIPGDLIQGGVSRKISIEPATSFDGSADFVVADLQLSPLEPASWDLAIALNTIDMLEDPAALPRLQAGLLAPGGMAIQSCPYIWHESVAKELRARLPAALQSDSARAVEWLYEQEGLKVQERVDHLPWLFFKHLRQLEIYSVHLFTARKAAAV